MLDCLYETIEISVKSEHSLIKHYAAGFGFEPLHYLTEAIH